MRSTPRLFFMLVLGSLLLTLFASVSINSVSGAGVIIRAQTSGATGVASLIAYHPSTNASRSALSTNFAPNADGYVTNILVNLRRTTGTAGTITCGLFNQTNMDVVASGVSLENSTTTYNITSLTTGYQSVNFVFSGTIQLVTTSNYTLYVKIEGGDPAAVQIDVQGSTTEVYGGGNSLSKYVSGAWALDNSAYDMYFTVTGQTETAATTPAPFPTAGAYDVSDTDALIAAIMGYLVPLILWLLPAFMLGFVTKWNGWTVMIGLAIGGGLCYLFLGTQYVWMVFLIAIGIAAMAYNSFRGNRN